MAEKQMTVIQILQDLIAEEGKGGLKSIFVAAVYSDGTCGGAYSSTHVDIIGAAQIGVNKMCAEKNG